MWFQTPGERITAMWATTIIAVVFLLMNPLMGSETLLNPHAGALKPRKPTPGACSGPLTISSGGTYTGCYESNDPATPAINITTTSAVTLSRVTIKHRGQGVRGVEARADLTVTDSTFTAYDPGSAPAYQTDIYLYQPTAVVIDNNRFTDGHGVLIGGNSLSTSPLQIRRNDFVNVGHFNEVTCCNGAVHFDQVSAPSGATVSWNRAVNTYGQSLNEDVIGIFQSNGASGNPIMIDHNLINGSYPLTGNGSGFTGSGINIGDNGGTWQTGDSNTVVNSANIGIAVAFGTTGNNLTHTNSTVVSDGKAGINDSGPTVSSTFGNGVNAAGGAATGPIVITNNQSGFRRWNGTSFEAADYFIPDATSSSGNTNISPVDAAAEQSAVDAWESARVSAGVTIGPRPL